MFVKKIMYGVVLLATAIYLQGCVSSLPKIAANPYNPIRTVAILPMVNDSVDVEAPEKIRKFFAERLGAYYYQIQPLEETRRILNEQMGISLGKQLELTTPKQLGETLGVDGVFYGYLLNFDKITTGVYNQNKVRMGWKLVNAKTGEVVWGKGAAVSSSSGMIGSAGALSGISVDEVGPLPASLEPMKEMPGLERWINIEAKNSGGGFTGALINGVVDIAASGILGTKLNQEIEAANNIIFTNMLVGPGSL